jgi:hypothetical protein
MKLLFNPKPQQTCELPNPAMAHRQTLNPKP